MATANMNMNNKEEAVLLEFNCPANVQFVETPAPFQTGQFEVVRGRRLTMTIKKENLEKLTFRVKHRHIDFFERPLRNCGSKLHNNRTWEESPFLIEAANQDLETLLWYKKDESDHFVCELTNVGLLKEIYVTLFCLSTDEINQGQIEKARKWAFEIEGFKANKVYTQTIPVQCFIRKNAADRLKPRKSRRAIQDRKEFDNTLYRPGPDMVIPRKSRRRRAIQDKKAFDNTLYRPDMLKLDHVTNRVQRRFLEKGFLNLVRRANIETNAILKQETILYEMKNGI